MEPLEKSSKGIAGMESVEGRQRQARTEAEVSPPSATTTSSASPAQPWDRLIDHNPLPLLHERRRPTASTHLARNMVVESSLRPADSTGARPSKKAAAAAAAAAARSSSSSPPLERQQQRPPKIDSGIRNPPCPLFDIIQYACQPHFNYSPTTGERIPGGTVTCYPIPRIFRKCVAAAGCRHHHLGEADEPPAVRALLWVAQMPGHAGDRCQRAHLQQRRRPAIGRAVRAFRSSARALSIR